MANATKVVEYAQANITKLRDWINDGTYDIVKFQDGTKTGAAVIGMMLHTADVTARDSASVAHAITVQMSELAINPAYSGGGLYDIIHNMRQFTAENPGGIQAEISLDGAAPPDSRVRYIANSIGVSTITVNHVNAGANLPLVVTVTGFAISVQLETGPGPILSTAADVAAAVNAHAVAGDLVTAQARGTGLGLCVDEGPATLAGGAAYGTYDYWKIYDDNSADTGICLISKALADQLGLG